MVLRDDPGLGFPRDCSRELKMTQAQGAESLTHCRRLPEQPESRRARRKLKMAFVYYAN